MVASTPTSGTRTPAPAILAMPLPPRSPHPLAHALIPASPLGVQVSPLAVVSMLDHYIRRNLGTGTVAGALLGHVHESGDEVSVTDCFPIPWVSDKDLQLDTTYALKMYQLLRKTNQKEVVVGFYLSGQHPTDLAASLHDTLAPHFFSTTKQSMHGVMLMFDPTLKNDSLDLCGYLGLPITALKVKSQGRIFIPVPVHHEKLAKNFVALEPISRASRLTAPHGTAPLLDEVKMTQVRMESLSELLGQTAGYLETLAEVAVPSAKAQRERNAHGRCITAVLAPADPVHLARMETEVRDFKTVVQLAEQAQRQIKISEKISFGMPAR